MEQPFGHYRISPWHRWLPAVTRWCGTDWFGHALAHALRRIFILTHPETVDAVLDGIRFRFHLADNVCERRYFFTPAYYDRLERELIREKLGEGGVFVDVGANVGLYTLWAASRVGETGRVLALEPNPAALARLQFNVAANRRFSNVTVVAAGASDRTGEIELHLDPTNLGGSTMCAAGKGSRSLTVPCAPLIETLRRYGIDRVDMMKLDIEGYEDVVLRHFFSQAPADLFPGYLLIENSEALSGRELAGILDRSGYKRLEVTRMNAIYRRVND